MRDRNLRLLTLSAIIMLILVIAGTYLLVRYFRGRTLTPPKVTEAPKETPKTETPLVVPPVVTPQTPTSPTAPTTPTTPQISPTTPPPAPSKVPAQSGTGKTAKVPLSGPSDGEDEEE